VNATPVGKATASATPAAARHWRPECWDQLAMAVLAQALDDYRFMQRLGAITPEGRYNEAYQWPAWVDDDGVTRPLVVAAGIRSPSDVKRLLHWIHAHNGAKLMLRCMDHETVLSNLLATKRQNKRAAIYSVSGRVHVKRPAAALDEQRRVAAQFLRRAA